MGTDGKQQGEAAMRHTTPVVPPKPSKPVRIRTTRPAGEQAIGSQLYAQIRQAIAELKR